MRGFTEAQISKAILDTHHKRLSDCLVGDVLIAGAGPSGLVAAYDLARQGLKVTILEKRLAPGGGIWGGGMAMPEVVIQQEVTPLLDELGLTHAEYDDGLHVISAIELAAGLVMKAVQAGATMLNLTTAEDVSVRAGRVTGLVANRTNIGGELPVDPIMFESRAVIDGTGHDAFIVACLRRRGLLPELTAAEGFGEGPMDAAAGEEFVTKRASEIYPGLWVSGMSVCAAIGGPRMGPIFGGMLQSGRHAAQQILTALGKR